MQLFANNVTVYINQSILSTDTKVLFDDVSKLPVLGPSDFFLITFFVNNAGVESNWEIIKVTSVTGNECTIVRGFDGTVAREWPVGTVGQMRINRSSMEAVTTNSNSAIGNANAAVATANEALSESLIRVKTGDLAANTGTALVKGAWFGGVAAYVSELALSVGSSLIGFVQSGTGAVARSAQSKMQDTISVKDFGAVGNGIVDDTEAIQNAIYAGISQNKSIYIPGGNYILNGADGSDSYKNGILVPFNTINADPKDGISIFGDAGKTILNANSNNMIIFRISRNCVTLRDVTIDGNNLTGVIGIGVVPESIVQTSTQVSQSFSLIDRVFIQNCSEGIVYQPGPSVMGQDSGCFYHNLNNCYFNNNIRHTWMKPDSTSSGNRTTRSKFNGIQFLRGNTGIHIDAGTEIDFISCNFEMINTGSLPNSSPTGLFFANNPIVDNIRLIGGYAESVTTPINASITGRVYSFGFMPNSTSPTWKNVSSYGDFLNNGQWSPVVSSSGGGSVVNITLQNGYYSRNGRVVSISGTIGFDKGTLLPGGISIQGLPFAAKSSINAYQYINIPEWSGISFTANYTKIFGRISPGSASIALLKSGTSGVGSALFTVAELASTGNFLSFQASYLVD